MATRRTARRGRGEGSIYFDDKRGLWTGSVEVPTGDGRRRRRYVRAKVKDDMLAKLRKLQSQIDGGQIVAGPSTTTGDWVEWWLANVLPGTVADSTATDYGWVARRYLIPNVGRVPLAKLGPEQVQAMLRAMERAGLSARTRTYARAVLRRSLRKAEEWGKVSRNAAALTDAPRKAGTKLDDALDADEAAKVLETARGDRLEALAVVVLTLGLRKGEALRLRWDDIDLDAATLAVRTAKTKAGVRTVALAPMAVAALREHRARQRVERMASPVWVDPGLVFSSTIGTELDGRNVLRWWHDLTIRAGVGRRRFHATRHTAATLMLNTGVPLEVVSATLGHAGLAITADVYAKVRPDLQRTAADAMESLLGGQSGTVAPEG